MKSIRKKKIDPVEVFNYLQNNPATSDCDYIFVVDKIREFLINKMIDGKYNILKPMTDFTNDYQQNEVLSISSSTEIPIVVSPDLPIRAQTATNKIQPINVRIDNKVADGSYIEILENDLDCNVEKSVNTFDIDEPILVNLDESDITVRTRNEENVSYNIMDTSITELENYINQKYLETCKQKLSNKNSSSLPRPVFNNSILDNSNGKNYGTFDIEHNRNKEKPLNTIELVDINQDEDKNSLQFFNQFLIEEIKFLRDVISSKNKIIETLLNSSLHNESETTIKKVQKESCEKCFQQKEPPVNTEFKNYALQDDNIDFLINEINQSIMSVKENETDEVVLNNNSNKIMNDIYENKDRRKKMPSGVDRSQITNTPFDSILTDNIIPSATNNQDQDIAIEKTIDELKNLINKCQEFQKSYYHLIDNKTIAKECQETNKNDIAETVDTNGDRESDTWKKGTTLIMGDSIVAGLREYKMSNRKSVKVRSFPGARINDMFYYAVPLLRKKPDKIIIHIGTNDAPHMTPEDMMIDLQKLKDLILKLHPGAKIILSTPLLRTDKFNANENNKKNLLNY